MPEQPNWVDSAVSCLLLTCMTSSSLTEGPASAVLWLSKVVSLERMFKQAIAGRRRLPPDRFLSICIFIVEL